MKVSNVTVDPARGPATTVLKRCKSWGWYFPLPPEGITETTRAGVLDFLSVPWKVPLFPCFCHPLPCCSAPGCRFHVWLQKLCRVLALTAGCQLRACPSSPPSLREDCRGNTMNVVSSAIAGCNQCSNEVLEVKCHFNLLIVLKGQQIALYHFFLIFELIKEY